MTFIYPRTIAVTRPQGQTGVGDVGYSGVLESTETAVISGIPANIQLKTAQSRQTSGGLPAAPPGPPVWRVFIPLNAVAKGVIVDRDIVTDDLGERYQIIAAYWNSMGWNIACIRLEAR
ncbi:hypothetical protein [Rhizobium lusitanum]|uniref:hypothetical protein n=1 Tax=Rhizobium lusitanum TaxID=293958 RepID=UPI001957F4C8|nr:hypothetical protein [Rhizobium lusitanum]MBM7045438.1 hypothetical protein [Rhizobium lusitanum]